MLYTLKQFIGGLFAPLTLALFLAAIALALRLLRRPRTALWCFLCAAFIAYAGSTGVVARTLLRPLEQAYPPLDVRVPIPAVKYIVVLGAEYNPSEVMPVTAQLGREGLARGVEGVRLARLLPEARLVLSGGAPRSPSAPARGYQKLARALGVADASIVVLDNALDTSGEARNVAAFLGEEPFLLVTGAYHMPRAMQLMQLSGATHAIPAPTGQLMRHGDIYRMRDLLPNSGALRTTENAMHEYLGLAAIAAGMGQPARRNGVGGTPLAP